MDEAEVGPQNPNPTIPLPTPRQPSPHPNPHDGAQPRAPRQLTGAAPWQELDSQYRGVMEAKQRQFEQEQEQRQREEREATLMRILSPRTAALLSWLAFGRVCWDHGFLQIWGMLTMIGLILTCGLGSKSAGEKSAYSVFNKGMAPLAGTFGASDFEATLRSKKGPQKDFAAALDSDDDDDEGPVTLKTIGKRKKAERKRAQLHTGGHTLGGS